MPAGQQFQALRSNLSHYKGEDEMSQKSQESLEIKQEVTHGVVARRRKKCAVDIEAEGCPPKVAKVAAWSLLTLE